MSKRAFRIRLKDTEDTGVTLPTDLADAERADLETLSLVASRAGNAIMILGSDGTVQWANPSFHRLSGYESNEARHGKAEGFSIEAGLKRMSGEKDLLYEHLGYVLTDMPQLTATMKQAAAAGDAKQLEIAAHRLKSLVSSYDHIEAVELTQAIESDAKASDLSEAPERLAKLEPILQSFARAVDDYLQSL